MNRTVERLRKIQCRLSACEKCPAMIGPVVLGQPVDSKIYLVGQAPGPHEGKYGKPFAWTAGKTLFRWFGTLGVEEEEFRSRVYMAAVARCFPGKAVGGGDRRPDPNEIAACRQFMDEEIGALQPKLIIPIGAMAIEQMLGRKAALADVVGGLLEIELNGQRRDLVCLPHPSGASTWHRTQPGISLLKRALEILREHPEWRRAFKSGNRSTESENLNHGARNV